jgi:hypothetical protein
MCVIKFWNMAKSQPYDNTDKANLMEKKEKKRAP